MLEPEHKGEVVAIEIKTGDYFLGKSVIEADRKARKRYPDEVFYFGTAQGRLSHIIRTQVMKMDGHIDEYGQARVDVIGRKIRITVSPVIDTGFDGDLCLPLPIAIQLGLELSGPMEAELADGAVKKELIFTGLTKFSEETKEIILT